MSFIEFLGKPVEVPEYITASWDQSCDFLEKAVDGDAEIICYTDGKFGLILDGIQRILADTINEFDAKLDAFVLGLKIGRMEATDTDYI